MKLRVLLCICLCTTICTACSTEKVTSIFKGKEEPETVTEVVKTYEELVDEYMQDAYAFYRSEIGVTTAGERIVRLVDYGTVREYSVYIFDDRGYSHDFYIFAYEDSDYEYNQTERVEKINAERKSLVTDDKHHAVYYRQEYIDMGANTYEFFRAAILKEYKAEQHRLDLDKLDDVEFLTLENGAESKIIGELKEFIPPEPKYEVDSAGWVLALDDERLFRSVSVNGGVAITGYDGTGGNKLVFPTELNGQAVVELRCVAPVEGIEAVEIPPTVLKLTDAFKGWTGLKYVFFSEGLKEITTDTFKDSGVEQVSLPDTVERIGEGFYSVSGFLEIKVPAGVTELNGTFRDLSVSEFIVPGTVKVVGDNAFAGCRNLTTVFLEEGVEAISDTAFEGCTALQGIALPRSVQEIAYGAIPSNVLLVVPAGSYAQEFAEYNDYTFVAQ